MVSARDLETNMFGFYVQPHNIFLDRHWRFEGKEISRECMFLWHAER